MVKEVTSAEVEEALKRINPDSALWIDGMNASFSTKIWYIIKDDMCKAIKIFFSSKRMYRPINCTNITLLPKVLYAKTIK